jgi:hypothetical protein
VTVKVDSTTLATLPYSGTISNTVWSPNWTPTTSKVYTLTAIMTPAIGSSYTDVISVTYQAPEVCFAEVTGDNATDYQSVDAGAVISAVAATLITVCVR